MQHPDISATTQPGTDWGWDAVEFTTYCPNGSEMCVQYAKRDGMVALRSTQNPANVALLTDQEWADLLRGARTGEIA